eukprot:Pgem_evm1s18489
MRAYMSCYMADVAIFPQHIRVDRLGDDYEAEYKYLRGFCYGLASVFTGTATVE